MTNPVTFFPTVLDTVEFTLVGIGVAKQGCQSRIIASDTGPVIHQYTPNKVINWAAYIKLVASEHRRVPLWDGPIRARVIVQKYRPKSHKGKVYCHTKPDLDNLEKNIFDALHGVIYANDSRIVDKHITKVFSDTEETYIKLELLKDGKV